jgi:hypothetical protein
MARGEQLARQVALLALRLPRGAPAPAAAAARGGASAAATAAAPARAAAGRPAGLCGSWLRGFSSIAGGAADAAASAAGAAARPRSLARRLRATLRDYKQLSKARLSALVVLTASAGFAAGSGGAIDWAKLGWTSLGTFGAAACANALNQVYEAANDALMARTRGRPLPAGRMSRRHALAFAAAAGAGGLWLLAEKVGARAGLRGGRGGRGALADMRISGQGRRAAGQRGAAWGPRRPRPRPSPASPAPRGPSHRPTPSPRRWARPTSRSTRACTRRSSS